MNQNFTTFICNLLGAFCENLVIIPQVGQKLLALSQSHPSKYVKYQNFEQVLLLLKTTLGIQNLHVNYLA